MMRVIGNTAWPYRFAIRYQRFDVFKRILVRKAEIDRVLAAYILHRFPENRNITRARAALMATIATLHVLLYIRAKNIAIAVDVFGKSIRKKKRDINIFIFRFHP